MKRTFVPSFGLIGIFVWAMAACGSGGTADGGVRAGTGGSSGAGSAASTSGAAGGSETRAATGGSSGSSGTGGTSASGGNAGAVGAGGSVGSVTGGGPGAGGALATGGAATTGGNTGAGGNTAGAGGHGGADAGKPGGPNMIVNANFATGLAPWLYWPDGGTATVTTANNEVQYVITNSGTAGRGWAVMLAQKGLMVATGKSYHLSVDARSLDPFNLVVDVRSDSDPPNIYSPMSSWPLTATSQTFTMDFTITKATTTPTGVIQFSFGGQKNTTVWVTNVVLAENTQ
jgi:hypothetical protein